MKVTLGCVLLCICIAISQSFPDQRGMKRKGFRMGAAQRFSHGFGKRAESLYDTGNTDAGWYLTSEELVQLISENPELGRFFIDNFVDRNGDGTITADEIVARR